MSPVNLRRKRPVERVATEQSVVIMMMFAASSASQSMAFAIMKLETAVGQATSMNRIPMSLFLKPVL